MVEPTRHGEEQAASASGDEVPGSVPERQQCEHRETDDRGDYRAGRCDAEESPARIAVIIGTKEAPQVSEDVRSLYRLRGACPEHTRSERDAFGRFIDSLFDQIDQQQMKRMLEGGTFPDAMRQEPNLTVLWRTLIRLAVGYYAAVDVCQGGPVPDAQALAQTVKSLTRYDRAEGGLSLRQYMEKMAGQGARTGAGRMQDPEDGSAAPAKICYGCQSPACPHTRATCPVWAANKAARAKARTEGLKVPKGPNKRDRDAKN